ncbi:hypothetical protein [Paenibacillus whitsoniae]|uniref:Uncharacterized protein n=1 Tax=Paenibacillus whitsoniae TaxID=2496558 RepID=A0A3S0C8D8_9BACL|nr:hypothetical protein [Paenibacillus whitsoniae]RTE06418.1 hypothetical protein EJQ19_22790 [Paenibacillus whitsoniae]
MKTQEEFILVSAPTLAGKSFIRMLQMKRIPFAAITNNESEKKQLEKLGVNHILMVDTTVKTWEIPDLEIGKVFMFEHSLTLCCRYIQICRAWTSKPIYVITQSGNARMIYKGIGANYVIHSRSEYLSFLLE